MYINCKDIAKPPNNQLLITSFQTIDSAKNQNDMN